MSMGSSQSFADTTEIFLKVFQRLFPGLKAADTGANASLKYLFISFSATEWDGPWFVRQKLMSEFSTEHKVIYVNQRKELREIIADILKRKKLDWGVRKINRNLFLIGSPWMFPK